MNATDLHIDYATITDRRERVRDKIATTAAAIANGERISHAELNAILELCQKYFLPVEAARVMRWMAP